MNHNRTLICRLCTFSFSICKMYLDYVHFSLTQPLINFLSVFHSCAIPVPRTHVVCWEQSPSLQGLNTVHWLPDILRNILDCADIICNHKLLLLQVSLFSVCTPSHWLNITVDVCLPFLIMFLLSSFLSPLFLYPWCLLGFTSCVLPHLA